MCVCVCVCIICIIYVPSITHKPSIHPSSPF